MTGLQEQFSHATVAQGFVFVCSAKLGKFVGQLRRIGLVGDAVRTGGEASVSNRPLATTDTTART